MAEEFTPITTQEQFDAMIKSRLERAESKVRSEYADYETLKTANAQLTADLETAKTGKTELEGTIATLTAENSGLKTESLKTKIGLEAGIPVEMLPRLNGTTAEEIKADAEALAKFVGNHYVAPLRRDESGNGDSKTAALKTMAQELFNH